MPWTKTNFNCPGCFSYRHVGTSSHKLSLFHRQIHAAAKNHADGASRLLLLVDPGMPPDPEVTAQAAGFKLDHRHAIQRLARKRIARFVRELVGAGGRGPHCKLESTRFTQMKKGALEAPFSDVISPPRPTRSMALQFRQGTQDLVLSPFQLGENCRHK
jgi:hypothetical protein